MEPLYVLKWHQEMGIHDLVEETPFDAFAYKKTLKTTAPLPKIVPANTVISESKTAIKTPVAAALEAKKLAEESNTLEALRTAVKEFKGLAITRTATNTVFADGNPDSEVMLIGEAPGADEDRMGIPFCGQSGQLLSQMLACIGLVREKNYYITNSLFWRPPGNRKPTPEEIMVCKPFVEKHIALIKPKIIILVGSTAVTAVLDKNMSITKIRGKFMPYSNRFLSAPIPVVPIFHPSYLLRSPGQKKYAWEDMLTIKLTLSNELNV